MSTFDIASLFSVKSKRVLITGGGSGLGRFLAEGLAHNGAEVYIVGRRKEKLEEVVEATTGRSGSVIAIQGDLSSKEGIAKVVEDYKKSGQTGLDVLVNGAGIARTLEQSPQDADKLEKQLWDDKWDDWSDSLDVNVASVYFTTVAFIPLLRRDSKPSDASESPSVVNVASIAGLHLSRTLPASYAASKAAALHLTRVLAARLIPFNIRVNGIAPGIFPSEMTIGTPMLGSAVMNTIPEHRPGTAEDYVGTIISMISRAGAYQNGNLLVLDGGRVLVQSANIGGSL